MLGATWLFVQSLTNYQNRCKSGSPPHFPFSKSYTEFTPLFLLFIQEPSSGVRMSGSTEVEVLWSPFHIDCSKADVITVTSFEKDAAAGTQLKCDKGMRNYSI
jgi:hypothetical protein